MRPTSEAKPTSWPVRNSLRNWNHVAPALLERVRREAVGGVRDPVTRELVANLQTHPDVAPSSWRRRGGAAAVRTRRRATGLLSIVTTVGSPTDVTAQEMRLEAFVPSNEATRNHWLTLGTAQRLENETRATASG
jgi:hypothetical protein